MGLLTKLREWKDKREMQVENKMLQRETTAKQVIEKLETRKRTLEEREKIFRQRDKLQEDIKLRESSVRELKLKESNPIMYSIKQNVQKKLAEAKKEREKTPLRSSINRVSKQNSSGNIFSSQANFSSPFVSKNNSNELNKRISASLGRSNPVITSSPLMGVAPKPKKTKKKGKQIVTRL